MVTISLTFGTYYPIKTVCWNLIKKRNCRFVHVTYKVITSIGIPPGSRNNYMFLVLIVMLFETYISSDDGLGWYGGHSNDSKYGYTGVETAICR